MQRYLIVKINLEEKGIQIAHQAQALYLLCSFLWHQNGTEADQQCCS